jgi:hypothetical protein
MVDSSISVGENLRQGVENDWSLSVRRTTANLDAGGVCSRKNEQTGMPEDPYSFIK